MTHHRFYGAPDRFEILADYIAEHYWQRRCEQRIRYIADVAGGQGMLARILNKKYHFDCEVIDPRGHVLPGVRSRAEEFRAQLAGYYDLIIGLHCDEALREVAAAARIRPVVLIPCCNFWCEAPLGQQELLCAVEDDYRQHGVTWERVTFPFQSAKNIGLVSEPPK